MAFLFVVSNTLTDNHWHCLTLALALCVYSKNIYCTTTYTNIGIGTSTPSTRLHIVTTAGAGTGFRLVDGTQSANRVLTSDANGNASWQAAPTEPLKALVTQLQTEVEVLKQQVFALCKN